MNIFQNVVKMIPLIVTAVTAVETLVTDKKGTAKQDAAVDMVRMLLPLIESAIGKDEFDDPQVQTAVRSAIDAIVALEKTVTAAKQARIRPAA